MIIALGKKTLKSITTIGENKNNMSERYSANPNSLDRGADQPHSSRYFVARGFIKPGEVVVDSACGHGYGSAILSEVASKVLALDKVDVFNGQWKKEGIGQMVVNLEELEEYPECDVWVTLETIEHLADPEKYLDKVTKSTKRAIIVSSPNKPTAGANEFHLTDVELPVLEKLMNKHEDWFLYQTLLQGYYYIAVYVKKNTEML